MAEKEKEKEIIFYASLDKSVEDDILERLENGDLWAWAYVVVTASVVVDGERFKGSDSLGGCNYRDAAEFMQPGGYYLDMMAEAKLDLVRALESAVGRGEIAAHVLKRIER